MAVIAEQCSTYGRVAEVAREQCESGPVLNLVLTLRTPVELDHDTFIDGYLEKAQLWQSKDRPAKLLFSHGEYMNRKGNALEYVISQLKSKPSGNRACISLVDTGDFIGSADDPIPSFLLLQAGFDPREPAVLYLSAYYRALEVGQFLPINLAEMALITDQVSSNIPTVRELDLTIFAFRAHWVRDFRTLEHSELDAAGVDAIRTAVRERNLQQIVEWLSDKDRPETIVDTSGVASLRTELSDARWAGDDLLACMDRVVSAMTQLQEARRNGSHADRLDSLHARVSEKIRESVRLIRALPKD